MTQTINELVFENRDSHSNTNPDGGLVFYFMNGLPYLRGDEGYDVVQPSRLNNPTAQYVASGVVTLTKLTDVQIPMPTANWVDIEDIDYNTGVFSLGTGIYEINATLGIDNTPATSQGVDRHLTLLVTDVVVDEDFQAKVGSYQYFHVHSLVNVATTDTIKVKFYNDADTNLVSHSIAKIEFKKVG